MELKGKKVTIIGAAKSGIAAANLVQVLGGLARISDNQPLEKIEKALVGLKDRRCVEIEFGGHTKEFVTASDLIVASPGVWKDAPPLEWARAAGIPVMGEIEFAWRFCKKPVVAVTGSNGKTTTVTLITRILEASGKRACLCGNVGTPFSARVLEPDVDIFVVEISSFQLELCETFRPYVAVLLNFSKNHLDRHPTMQDYFDAKKRLFMNQTPGDFAVLNDRDELVRSLGTKLCSQVRFFNKPGESVNPDHLAVLEVGKIFGVSETAAQNVFDTFPGVEHRTEKVRVLDGVTYINDSKATTAESGAWALSLLPGPIIMIAGGHDKGEIDFSAVIPLARQKVKKMIVLTREDIVRQKLHKAFEGVVPLEDQTDMAEAVRSARAQASSGDRVLLTPMFASFDMFSNFEHRGQVFKEIVTGL
ncbi:MAG: UDP-N-acetylmuramoyl-L-alanine--D-glutamate ligase [Candidatus Omnitrophica bacterium]|nr:UDP-N-acetylmuramoyl-L-alanine--D-glutamate ligase [Candidatus Omnitrophota bacterium]